ncbi:MAG: hypothetical protein J6Z00_02030, partial [Clostridia bacterium]|nr:hypothetical protein [Clostridia bacterium]
MSITMLSSAELQGTVLYESSSSFSKTAKAGKVGSWFKQVTAIRADIIANGAIHPDQGEYYEVVVTGYVSSGSASIYLGENVSWEEYHGTGESLTTTEKTVTW